MISQATPSVLVPDLDRGERAVTTTPIRPGSALHLQGVVKRFGEHVAVAGIDLDIAAGTTLGFLGPNGAGKTTTLHLTAGLTRPTAGSVAICGGHDPTTKSARSLIGIAPQRLALYPDLTARENLAFFGSLFGLRGRALRRRVDWGLDLARLNERRDGRVDTLSGGMQRRLNLACALIHEPKLLLLDEPTVGVDPQSRNYIFDCIEQLKSSGLTIVYSTHYMEEAERLCDDIAIVDAGRIVARGSVAQLVREHGGAARVEACFCGDAPELPGAQRLEAGRLRFVTDTPMTVVERLMARDPLPRSLTVRAPDLETVFLNLTGKRLRD